MTSKRRASQREHETIESYFATRDALLKRFGFEDKAWRVFPLDDQRGMYWMLVGGDKETGRGVTAVRSNLPFDAEMMEKGEAFYSGPIYMQRHLQRGIWRAKEHTMLLVDTQCDLNTFLMVFENALECTDESLGRIYSRYWGGG